MLSAHLCRISRWIRLCILISLFFFFPISGQTQSESQGSSDKDNPEALYSTELLRIRTLIKAGVLDLAEQLLENEGPEMSATQEWLVWEKQLWKLYSVRNQWEDLIARAEAVPITYPSSFRRLAELQIIDGLIALGRSSEAREILRKQYSSFFVSEVQKREIRQIMIESYLAEGLLEDARIAMNNFQSDYRSQDAEWLILSAKIHLLTGNPDGAILLLAPLDDPMSRLLLLYARLINDSLSPDQVIDQAIVLIDSRGGRSIYRQIVRLMIAANQRAGRIYPQIDLLEELLELPPSQSDVLTKIIPEFNADTLADSYAFVAKDIANQAGLLSGEEELWPREVENLASSSTVAQKSVNAYVALMTQYDSVKHMTIDRYINILIDTDKTALINTLFGDEALFGPLILNQETGLRLSNIALEKADFVLAAKANDAMTGIPGGMSERDWLLHSARVSIIAGRYEEGINHLRRWLQSQDKLTPDDSDKILQVLFDLQTIGKHKEAIPLFTETLEKSPSKKYQREIVYWLAESYYATEQYIKAADLFLDSALQKNNGFDQWGESARFKAAESLHHANLIQDAKSLFEGLLKRSTEESRTLSLKQKLQELWLLESNQLSTEQTLIDGEE